MLNLTAKTIPGLIIVLLTFDLFSRADALTFTPPLPLNVDMAETVRDNGQSVVMNDGAGTWVAVWFHMSGAKSADDLYFARSLDNGVTWNEPAPLKTNHATDNGNDYDASLATDGNGHWVVTWHSQDTYSGALGRNGNIMAAHSADNGATWSPSVLLSSDGDGLNISPVIATDKAGNWVTVWMAVDNSTGRWITRILAAGSADNGAHWTDPMVLGSYSDYMNIELSLATDENGRWIAFWEYPTYGAYQIAYSISDDNGDQWTLPGILNTGMTDGHAPSVATDKQGRWVVAWHDSISKYGGDYDIFYCRSTDNGQTWSESVILNMDAVTDAVCDDYVKVAINNAGTWVAAWSRFDVDRAPLGHLRTVVYAVSTDEGASWSIPFPLYPSDYRDIPVAWDNLFVSLACGTDECWVIAWSSRNFFGTLGYHRDVFYAINTMPDPVHVESPNGGETWQSGMLQQVRWQTNPATAGTAIRVELWNSQGRVLDLGYDWSPVGDHVAEFYLPLLPSASDYRIRVVSTWNQQYYDESDQALTILGNPVRIRYPNGGETWHTGTIAYIHWDSNAAIAGTSVRLEVWRDSTYVRNLVVQWEPSGDGLVQIVVPFVPTGDNYRIRAVSTWNPVWFDESDESFTIIGDPVKSAANDIWILYP